MIEGLNQSIVGCLLSSGWVLMSQTSGTREMWKPNPGGPPFPAVIIHNDGSLHGARMDVSEAQNDIRKANNQAEGRR
jgi:hypothetical protein